MYPSGGWCKTDGGVNSIGTDKAHTAMNRLELRAVFLAVGVGVGVDGGLIALVAQYGLHGLGVNPVFIEPCGKAVATGVGAGKNEA